MVRVHHMAFLWPNFALLLWETFTICNSCLSLSCIVYCSSNSCTDSLSFSVLSKVSFTFSHALAFSSCFSWFILRLLQRWDWTWDDWLLTLCTTRFVHQTCIFCHRYLCTNSWLHVLCICCSCCCTVANTVNPFKKHVSSYLVPGLVFLIFISLLCISVLGIDIASVKGHVYLPVILVLATLSPFATLLYRCLYVALHWICSRRRCTLQTLVLEVFNYWTHVNNDE